MQAIGEFGITQREQGHRGGRTKAGFAS
jgi:hypothetical protein